MFLNIAMVKFSSPRAAFLLHLVVCAVLQTETSADECTSTCDTLYLLHVVPYHDSDEHSGWDKGLEVIPAGFLATQHINSSPDLLRGHKLAIINIESEACARNTAPLDGYVELFSKLSSSEQKCVFGVIGLYCSSVTSVIAPLLSHPRFGYIQLTSSTSPLLHTTKNFPYLFSVVTSSEVYSRAVMAMMDEFNWTRISVIFDFDELVFRSSGLRFAKLIDTTPELDLLTNVPFLNQSNQATKMFDEILKTASRLSYLSVTVEESGMIMCEAYHRHLVWPDYVYIFPDRTVAEIMSYSKKNKSCSEDIMLSAIEGIFILQYRLFVSNNTTLLSGKMYQSYYDEYMEALDISASKIGMDLKENEYANTLYDQVWAFALAMNNSMDKINISLNGSFKNIVNRTPDIRRILAKELRNISFQGASGTIRFDNENQEVQTVVDIYQVRNGQQVLIAVFESYPRRVSFQDNFDKQPIPPDSFEHKAYMIAIELRVTVLILQGLLLIILFISTTALIYWRKRPVIKSTSLYISFIILIGCLLMCISPILNTIFTTPTAVLCNVDLWCSLNGISIVVVALLFRLLRIVYVFRSFHSTGKFWSDMFLVLYITLTSCIMIVFLLVWLAVDHVRLVTKSVYINSAHPPFYLNFTSCSSNHFEVWLAVAYTWIGLLLIIVLCLAIKTRHIKHKNFKDTKKVNAFIFSICIIVAISIPLVHLLIAVNIVIGAYILKWLSFFTIVSICQLLLFFPKYVPLLCTKSSRQRTTTFSRQGTTTFPSQRTMTISRQRTTSFSSQRTTSFSSQRTMLSSSKRTTTFPSQRDMTFSRQGTTSFPSQTSGSVRITTCSY